MRKKQFLYTLCLLAAPVSLWGATISVQPAALAKTAGQTFTVSINISGANDLYAYQFDLGFDPTVLKATSVTEGSFLPSGGSTIFIPGTIDNLGGSITANGDALLGALSGVTGDGDLLDVSFQALTPGTSSIQV